MMINEHKEHLLDMMDSMPDDTCGDWRDSLAYAIDIMHKYQKIEDIVNHWACCGNPTDSMIVISEIMVENN